MAARIDVVEREFLILNAAEAKTQARIQAQGRVVNCPMAAADKSLVRFAPKNGEAQLFRAWETVSVYFDFRGQVFVFESTVRRATRDSLELAYPESMYKGLSRRWPRVKPPRELSVDLILPDGALKLPCPLSREYVHVDLPARSTNLKADSLAGLVASFKAEAEKLCEENRVVMFKDGRGPADIAEDLVSSYGRAIFAPSLLSGLPIIDPYPEGRLVTKADLELVGDSSVFESSNVQAFFEDRYRSGLQAAIWCPVRYYRYTIGVVYLGNRRDATRPFDMRLLDFAWDFSSLLAWFLKRHGYFEAGGKPVGAAPGLSGRCQRHGRPRRPRRGPAPLQPRLANRRRPRLRGVAA